MPRYHEPILIHPAAFEWVPVPGVSGAWEKNLGVFGERRNEVRMLHLARGGSVKVGTDVSVDLLFVIDGRLQVGEQHLGDRDAFSLEASDGLAELRAAEESTIFWTVLPSFPPQR